MQSFKLLINKKSILQYIHNYDLINKYMKKSAFLSIIII